MENKELIIKATGGHEILAVIAGLPVDADGHFFTQNQMETLGGTLKAHADAPDVTKVQEELTTAKGDVTRLTTELGTATGALTKANEDLVAANATIAELKKQSGKPSGTSAEADPARGEQNDPNKYLTEYDTMFQVQK